MSAVWSIHQDTQAMVCQRNDGMEYCSSNYTSLQLLHPASAASSSGCPQTTQQNILNASIYHIKLLAFFHHSGFKWKNNIMAET